MVNFNISEFRGYHGRWAPGGPHHPHLRHRRGLIGAAEGVASAGIRDAERESRTAERDAARAARTADAGIIRTGERMARAQGISRSELSRAERAAGIGTGRGAEKSSEEKARSEERKATRRGSRYGHRYHPLLRHAMYGARPVSGILRGAALARLLRGTKKTTAASKHISIPSAGAAKAKAKVKAPAKKKAAAKKAPAAKRPVTIKPPKAPLPKRTAGAGKGKGAAQKVTPSAQVMSNLARYTNAPGGVRAGIGTAGRSSMSSTGRTAGSRVGVGVGVGGAGAGARSSGSPVVRRNG